jgi:putative hemolysin
MMFAPLLIIAVLLAFTSFVQLLYLESVRIIPREYAALRHFRDHMEERIGLRLEAGSLTFSLWKHSLLAFLGVFCVFVIAGPTLSLLALLEALLLSLALMLVFSYLIPQLLYRRSTGSWLQPMLPLVKLLALIATPLISLLGFLQSLYELGADESSSTDNSNGEAELESLITAGEEQGILEESDRQLIESVVAFGDKRVREVMTPRQDVVAIGHDATVQALRELLRQEQYSRLPVFEGNLDRFVGFIHVRDVFSRPEAEADRVRAADIMKHIPAVPETKKVQDLLDQMRSERVHMAAVIDEYGDAIGIVTMEDLMEEVFGEINDEHDPAVDHLLESDGSILASGSLDLDYIREMLPDEQREATTLAGLALEWFGRVPRPGERMERQGVELEIVASNHKRVTRLRLRRAENTEEKSSEQEPAA